MVDEHMADATATTTAGEETTPESSSSSPSKIDVMDVTIHPLVLLSAADHYHRVARGTRKRVVGVLLGQVHRGKVDATNSFAVPFEEDSRNPAVFYFDHNFVDNMLIMFKKVNAKERVIGFYSTGPQIRPNDLRIYDIVGRFVPSGSTVPPVFCIIDIRPDRPDLPVTAYKVVEEVSNTTTTTALSPGTTVTTSARQVQRSFAHVPCQMGALEAEEVGVEHLLRDINDPTVSTVASLIQAKLTGLQTLTEKLVECKDYLQAVVNGDIEQVNTEIISNLQTILNLLPNLNSADFIKSMIIKTNDMHSAIYLASVIRSVVALHDLVNNKIQYGETDTFGTASAEEKKEDAPATDSASKKQDGTNNDKNNKKDSTNNNNNSSTNKK